MGSAMRRAGPFGLAIALGLSIAAGEPAEPLNEYQVKAAYLYNFAKFVEWPAGAFRSPSAPIEICILGRDPFGRWLTDLVDGRQIDGRPLIVRHTSNAQQASGCHILFVSSFENKRLPAMLAEIKTSGLLIVGESDTSRTPGVVINFRLEGANVRFEIDVNAAARAEVRISSRLLALGRIVRN
jgi:hypothetical protein